MDPIPRFLLLILFALLASAAAVIGDETSIIAVLMVMRHPKSIVLSGALSALYVTVEEKLRVRSRKINHSLVLCKILYDTLFGGFHLNLFS